MGNNKIIEGAANDLERAALLNSRINANAQIMGNLIVSTGRDLKEMRDKKLYIHMGCESFDEYCEKFTPYKKRNAYNFIQCLEEYGDERLEELSTLGITKLTKLLALNTEDREELIESGDAEGMSTRELEKRIKELQNKNEQLTLELGEKSKDESDAIALKEKNERLTTELEAVKSVQDQQKQAAEQREKELQERIIALEQSNEQLASRPVDVAVEKPSADEIAKIEKAAAEKAEKAAKKQHTAEIKKLRDELDEARIVAVNAARNESREEIERLKSENAALQANAKKAPPSAEKERVKFHVGECLRSFNAALESLGALPEADREKPKASIKTMVDKMMAVLEEEPT